MTTFQIVLILGWIHTKGSANGPTVNNQNTSVGVLKYHGSLFPAGGCGRLATRDGFRPACSIEKFATVLAFDRGIRDFLGAIGASFHRRGFFRRTGEHSRSLTAW
ncbi:MAG: hypothetical protein ACKO2G_12915 [Verrucomicrobiales bacterium]